MPSMLLYLVKVTVSLAVVFLFYYFILRKLTFYNHNRWYLLGYTLLSFFIPFINISPVLKQNEWDQNTVINWLPSLGTRNNAARGIQEGSTLTGWDVLLIIIIIGMLLMLSRLVLQIVSFRRMKSNARVINAGGMNLYQVDEPIIPFSFGHSIFINSSQHSGQELQEIISHEFVHVKQLHSLDIIWAEILCLLNWYNPFAWLLRHSMRQNLEFIADNKVLEKGVNRKQYQYLLLKVIGNNQFSIASNFNFSSLKKRIAMMNKLKSTRRQLLRLLFLLPATAVLLLAFRSKWNGETKQHKDKDAIAGPVADANTMEPLKNASIYVKEKSGTDTIPTAPAARGENMMKEFLKRNPDVKRVGWVFSNSDDALRILIIRTDGTTEEYNLENEAELRKAEAKYGKLPVPPPPPPPPPGNAEMGELPIPVEAPAPPVEVTVKGVPGKPAPPVAYSEVVVERVPAPPEPRKLPENVKSISINNNKAKVTLKNGKEEEYDFSKPAELERFEKKYGEVVAPATPPAPVKHSSVGGTGSKGAAGSGNSISGTPIYVVDGKEVKATEVNAISPGSIARIDVLKGDKAVAAYGTKAKDGVVVVTTKTNEPVVVTGYPSKAVYVKGAEVAASDVVLKNRKELVMVDGKELPKDSGNLKGTFRIITLTKEEAEMKYGEKGKNGAIEITTIK